MSQETAASGTKVPVPPQRAGEQEPATDPAPVGTPDESIAPVRLSRMLRVATLSPAQASLVAVQLLDAASVGDRVNGGSAAGTGLGTVTLGPQGEVQVTRTPGEQGATLSQLLGQLLENARRLPAHPRPEQLVLLRRLEEAAAEPLLHPESRARDLEQGLVEVLGPDARQRLGGQLASLVMAFVHVAPGAPADPETRTLPPSSRRPTPRQSTRRPSDAAERAPRAAPARGSTRRRPRNRVLLHRRNRGRVALIALVLAAVLAVSGYVMLGGPGSDIVGSLGRDATTPAAPDTAAPDSPADQTGTKPKPKPAQPVPRLAPRQAGPITAVTLQKAGTCNPGALCPVTVTVKFRPETTSRTIAWKVGAAQVCKAGITWSGPVSVTAQPGWTTVYASSSVQVPKGRGLALTALTTAPARAQSRPVPVAGASLQC
jgi:hypothetical protein